MICVLQKLMSKALPSLRLAQVPDPPEIHLPNVEVEPQKLVTINARLAPRRAFSAAAASAAAGEMWDLCPHRRLDRPGMLVYIKLKAGGCQNSSHSPSPWISVCPPRLSAPRCTALEASVFTASSSGRCKIADGAGTWAGAGPLKRSYVT